MNTKDKNFSEDPNAKKNEGMSGMDKSSSANKGQKWPDDKSMQGSRANPTTTSRGADSTDKEFRNNQPNASTLKSHKSSADLDKLKKKK